MERERNIETLRNILFLPVDSRTHWQTLVSYGENAHFSASKINLKMQKFTEYNVQKRTKYPKVECSLLFLIDERNCHCYYVGSISLVLFVKIRSLRRSDLGALTSPISVTILVNFLAGIRPSQLVQSKVRNFKDEPRIDHAVGGLEVAVTLQLGRVKIRHSSNDIVDERSSKHAVQFDLIVFQYVLSRKIDEHTLKVGAEFIRRAESNGLGEEVNFNLGTLIKFLIELDNKCMLWMRGSTGLD